jgi:hypothetical protein
MEPFAPMFGSHCLAGLLSKNGYLSRKSDGFPDIRVSFERGLPALPARCKPKMPTVALGLPLH